MSYPEPIRNPEVKYTQLFINNEFVDAASGKTFPTINPTTGQKITDIQEGLKEDIDKAVDAAAAAVKPGSAWRRMTCDARGHLIYKLSNLMERDQVYLCSLESLDNGKPYHDAMGADMPLSLWTLRHYAGWADKIYGKTIDNGDFKVMTRHEPIGVCGQIIPWNFPMLMLCWKLGPALACGNTVVVKPAEQTPLTALYIASLAREAGFPPGVINIVPGYGPTAGAALSHHMKVGKIAFTGSGEVGQLVMEAAAKTNLKRVTLELGGKSPLIIMPDVDIDEAVNGASGAIFFNMGQVCTAGSRLFVHSKIYDEFVKKCVEKAKNRIVGDPFDRKSESGPQVDKDQFEKILNMIEAGKKEGATIQCGGNKLPGDGYFIENTLFTDVTPDMKIVKEEIFGPVQCIIKFDNLDEVLESANNTAYGLAAGIFTNDVNTYLHATEILQAGTVWVNCYNVFHMNVPFGGFKMSGLARELGEEGLRNYYEVKTIITKQSASKW